MALQAATHELKSDSNMWFLHRFERMWISLACVTSWAVEEKRVLHHWAMASRDMFRAEAQTTTKQAAAKQGAAPGRSDSITKHAMPMPWHG